MGDLQKVLAVLTRGNALMQAAVLLGLGLAAAWLLHALVLRLVNVDGIQRDFTQVCAENGQKQRKRHPHVRLNKPIKCSTLPPPYPNGWYSLCFSSQLKPGEVKRLYCLGRDLAVFRTSSPPYTAHAITAFCPHLGADLAGGRVIGQDLQCPFHHWRFAGDGKCTYIPGTDTIPAQANVETYHVVERNGLVLMWYHAKGEPPSWELPVVPELQENKFRCVGITEHVVACHIQEIPENGADVAHLGCLHTPFVLPALGLVEHSWTANWSVSAENGFASEIKIREKLSVLGHLVPGTEIVVEGGQVGPGVVYLWQRSVFGTILFVETVTPLSPLTQRVCHSVFASPSLPTVVGMGFLWAAIKQFERDVPVWSNKIFLNKPVLVAQDAAIGKYRRWFSQFYCDGSLTFEQAMAEYRDRGLDW